MACTQRPAALPAAPKLPTLHSRHPGYTNWDEIIGKVTGLVSSREPWFLQIWEPQTESLAVQAKRLACTDLLVAGAGSHMTNMIFLPPRAGHCVGKCRLGSATAHSWPHEAGSPSSWLRSALGTSH